jgi:hypothetical protein
VVLGQELAPAAIAELEGSRGRADDVGEENGREHTLRLRRLERGFAGKRDKERLDLLLDAFRISHGNLVRVSRYLDESS